MYKQRPAAIAELVANCWDSGSSDCTITLPDPKQWGTATAEIVIADHGCGMSEGDVKSAYLVLGRNRREDQQEGGLVTNGRRIMGRKGIGKLAGFGIADEIEVRTWKKGSGTKFTLLLDDLTSQDDEVHKVPIPGERFTPKPVAGASGTEVVLRRLRNKTPLEATDLRKSLASCCCLGGGAGPGESVGHAWTGSCGNGHVVQEPIFMAFAASRANRAHQASAAGAPLARACAGSDRWGLTT